MNQLRKDPPATIGNTGQMQMPDGSRVHFTVIDEIHRRQSTGPDNKIFYLQRLQLRDGQVAYRLGYYCIGRNLGYGGRWVWVQFAPIMPAVDFQAIVGEAITRGWILDE